MLASSPHLLSLGTKWDAGTSTPDFNVTIHGLSNVLHYGQGLFEGLKAFHCKDGKVRAHAAAASGVSHRGVRTRAGGSPTRVGVPTC